MDDLIYWVVLERRWLSVKAVGLYRTRRDAEDVANILDLEAGVGYNKYTVQRVVLED